MVNKMKRSSEFNSKGKLYLISTPIGNLGDFSIRAIDTLKSLDFLFCDDTRVTKKLLSHFDINLETDSYHDHSDSKKEEKIVSMIKSGMNVGLVSDAGTPIISDPGYEIVRRAIKEEITVIAIPGVTAQVTALTMSTLAPKPYLFYGFLSQEDKRRKDELETLKNLPYTIVFYESPHRIYSLVKDLYNVFGDRGITISREMTKIYEETIYFNLSEYESLPDNLKGEMVVVVEGYKEESKEPMTMDEMLNEVKLLVEKENKTLKEASKIVASKNNIKSSDLYNEYVKR